MNFSNLATFKQPLQIAALLLTLLLSSSIIYSNNDDSSQSLSSTGSSNYEFLGKIEAINQVESSKRNGEMVPEFEILNLNRGTAMRLEKVQLCNLENSKLSIFQAQQMMNLMWQAKNTDSLIKVSYTSNWEKCIRSVKLVQPAYKAERNKL